MYKINPQFVKNLEERIDAYNRNFAWLEEKLEEGLISEGYYKEDKRQTEIELALLTQVLGHYKYMHQQND